MARDADSVILACTELPILFAPYLDQNSAIKNGSPAMEVVQVPIVDTVISHVEELASISLCRFTATEAVAIPKNHRN